MKRNFEKSKNYFKIISSKGTNSNFSWDVGRHI